MKEWKGNYNAACAQKGVKSDHTTIGREPDDFYATDPVALEKLLDGCSSTLKGIFFAYSRWNIWEPACGTGNLAEVLVKRGYHVIATDLKDRGYGMPGYDFLVTNNFGTKGTSSFMAPIIITNPPYSLANEFIMHALDILPVGGVYAALMNITYLAGQKRYQNIYSKGSLKEVYIFSKRVECWRNNDKEKYGASPMVDFAWYIFQKGYKGQPTMYWL